MWRAKSSTRCWREQTPTISLSAAATSSRDPYDPSTDVAGYHNLITDLDHATLVKRLHETLEVEFGPRAVTNPKE